MGGRGSRSGLTPQKQPQPQNPQPQTPQPQAPQPQPPAPQPQPPVNPPQQPTQANTPQTGIAAVKDFKEFKKYMSDNFGADVTPSIKKADLETLKRSMAKIEFIMNELDGIKDIKVYTGNKDAQGNEIQEKFKIWNKLKTKTRAFVLGTASLDGEMTLNPTYFNDTNVLESSYARTVAKKFHPNGTGDEVMVHEFGHFIERALVYQAYPGSSRNDYFNRVSAWNNSRFSTQIVKDAADEVRKTAYGKNSDGTEKTTHELVANVSKYATKTRSETLAECVADYVANRNNANPLSQAVWSELKKRLSKGA